jgi:hypothetical protein
MSSEFNRSTLVSTLNSIYYLFHLFIFEARLCGLVVKVPGCRLRGPGSIPGATRFSEK